MGLDVRSWDYYVMCRWYPGIVRDVGALMIVPEYLRAGLWMWRDEF